MTNPEKNSEPSRRPAENDHEQDEVEETVPQPTVARPTVPRPIGAQRVEGLPPLDAHTRFLPRHLLGLEPAPR